jgi:hypothetical protein
VALSTVAWDAPIAFVRTTPIIATTYKQVQRVARMAVSVCIPHLTSDTAVRAKARYLHDCGANSPNKPWGTREKRVPLDTSKPVANFNGILTVKGTPIYQIVFVALVKNTAITFVFSGPADSVLGESKRSFPQWVSFDHSSAR